MAREFIEGFENGDLSTEWVDILGVATVAAGNLGGGGSYRAGCGGYNVWSVQRLVTSRAGYYGAFRVNIGAAARCDRIFAFVNGTTVLGSIRFDIQAVPARFRIYSGDQASLLGSSSMTPSEVTSYLIEFYYLPHVSNGTFILKVDGVEEINVTGAATSPSTANIDTIYLGGGDWNTLYYDNIIMDSSTWIGSTKICGLAPNGVGTTTQLTPTSGDNYTCVDEVPVSNTDYVYTNTNDLLDTYALTDLAAEAYAIKSLKVMVRADYDGAPTPTKLALAIRTNSTGYDSSDKTLSTSFANHSNLWEINPNTSAAWTPAQINALEIGVKAKA